MGEKIVMDGPNIGVGGHYDLLGATAAGQRYYVLEMVAQAVHCVCIYEGPVPKPVSGGTEPDQPTVLPSIRVYFMEVLMFGGCY